MSSECEIFQKEKYIKKKETKEEEEDLEEENNGEITQECTICFTSLNSTGKHRISSLKCGHVFGKCCIKEWLTRKQHNNNNNKCPICGKYASVKDIYPVYSKYTFVDKESLEKEIENNKIIKKRKINSQQEYEEIKEQYDNLIQEVNNSNAIIKSYESEISKLRWNPQQRNYSMKKFALVSTWKISNSVSNKRRFSRVFSINNKNSTIYIAETQNINKYGILGLNLETNKPVSYVDLHKGMIKDCKFNPINNLLLTTSTDKTVKLYSVNEKDNILSINAISTCWSCCWSKKNENQFFFGQGNSTINLYDLRKCNRPLSTVSNTDHMGNKPIVSLYYILKDESKYSSSQENSYDGVLGASLDKVFFFTPKQTASLVDNTPTDTLSTKNNTPNTTSINNNNNNNNSNNSNNSNNNNNNNNIISSSSTTSLSLSERKDHYINNIPSTAPVATEKPVSTIGNASLSLSQKENSSLRNNNNNTNLVKMDSIYSNMTFSNNIRNSKSSNDNEKYLFLSYNEPNSSVSTLSYDPYSNRCFVTYRKKTPDPNKLATFYSIGFLDFNHHSLFKQNPNIIIARNDQKLHTKSVLYTELNTENCYAVVSDDHAKSICVWQIGWNEDDTLYVHDLCQEIYTHDTNPIYDVNICTIKDNNYLCALNDNKLYVYQFDNLIT